MTILATKFRNCNSIKYACVHIVYLVSVQHCIIVIVVVVVISTPGATKGLKLTGLRPIIKLTIKSEACPLCSAESEEAWLE